ncbi:MAG: ThiF family adenylyltransferase [Nigerium sp.]|nr:ThiF family adenylyltransferase [Nigerium sp.]
MTRQQRRPRKTPEETPFSRRFRDELIATATTRPDLFPEASDGPAITGFRTARLGLDTTAMPATQGGLSALPVEPVLVVMKDDPDYPPRVYVNHGRFVGVPHVLTDGELCIYLDPQREWDPTIGAAGFLNRLHDWFADAIDNRFDAATALYHPVGGRAHTSSGTPLIVCRDQLPDAELGFAKLVRVTATRNDLRLDDGRPAGGDDEKVLVIRAPRPLFAGPGASVREVFANMGPELAVKALLAWSKRIGRQRRDRRDFAHLVLSVPSPAGAAPYVMVGRLKLDGLDAAATSDAISALPIEWCRLDDQRPSISTRRDAHCPVRAYQGRDVAIVGCGGLGSWVAEFIARAGARTLAVVDPATVKGGLLVRQDYTDGDVGYAKDQALARRLRSVAPDCETTYGAAASERVFEILHSEAGLVVDATVSLAFGRRLDTLLASQERKSLAVRVATDVGTGSLGLVVVSAGGGLTLDCLDVAARNTILLNGAMEAYHTLWQPAEHEELVPAKGCSIPTFHGSAADMAAVSAEVVNLVAPHFEARVSGVHLFALPHSGSGPAHCFISSEAMGIVHTEPDDTH